MKFKGKILNTDFLLGGPEDGVEVTISGEGKIHAGGREHEIVGVLHIKTTRAVVKDYKLGDFFEITLEQAKL